MATEPTTQPAPAPAPAPTPPTPPAPEPSGEQITLTTSQLAERLREQDTRTLARIRAEQEQKDRTAEQERLKAQAEWEELAKQHEQAVRDITPQLESATARYSALAERLNKQIEAGIKDWPAEARKMVPAGDDVAARLDAYENMRSLLEKGPLTPRTPGNAPNPRPQTGPSGTKATEDFLRESGRYNSI